MTKEDFNLELTSLLKSISDKFIIKGAEYSRNDNPFHNFDVGVQQSTTNESREDVIWGMARKHWISIQDIRNDIKSIDNLPSREMIDEKYGDMINYLIIEKLSIIDKINHERLPF